MKFKLIYGSRSNINHPNNLLNHLRNNRVSLRSKDFNGTVNQKRFPQNGHGPLTFFVESCNFYTNKKSPVK